jgi:hypothetical protein
MRVLRAFVRFSITIGLVGLSVAQDVKPVESPPFTVVISTPNTVAKAGSEVKLKIVMKNVSDHEIHYGLAATGDETDLQGGFRIDVRDAEGEPVRESAWGQKVHGTDTNRKPFMGSVFGGPIPLKPGQTFEIKRMIAKEYELNRPGRYTIQAERTDPKSNLVVKSNVIRITVIP